MNQEAEVSLSPERVCLCALAAAQEPDLCDCRALEVTECQELPAARRLLLLEGRDNSLKNLEVQVMTDVLKNCCMLLSAADEARLWHRGSGRFPCSAHCSCAKWVNGLL